MTTTQSKTTRWPKDRCTYTAFIGDNKPQGETAKLIRNLATVEGHVAAEEANEIDRLMTTITKEPRYALASIEGGKPSFEIINDFQMVKDHYAHNRTMYEIVRSLHLKQMTTDWYVFYESMATTRPVRFVNGKKELGPESTGNSIAFFPTKEDGIIGEMPWSRYSRPEIQNGGTPAIRQQTSHLPVLEQRNTMTHDRFLHALQKGDLDAVQQPTADNFLLITRNYYLQGEPILAVSGKAEARKHYAALHQANEVLGITILNRIVKDWYIFAELVWRLRGKANGKERQVRTAAMYPMALDGTILGELGYGTDMP